MAISLNFPLYKLESEICTAWFLPQCILFFIKQSYKSAFVISLGLRNYGKAELVLSQMEVDINRIVYAQCQKGYIKGFSVPAAHHGMLESCLTVSGKGSFRFCCNQASVGDFTSCWGTVLIRSLSVTK